MTDKTIDPLGTCQAIALSGNTRYYYLVHDFEIWNEYYDEKIDSNFARSLQNVLLQYWPTDGNWQWSTCAVRRATGTT